MPRWRFMNYTFTKQRQSSGLRGHFVHCKNIMKHRRNSIATGTEEGSLGETI